MSERIIQINGLLRKELAQLAAREIFIEDGLITITRVVCAPDLHTAKAYISVLPANRAGTALKALKQNSALFNKELKKKIKIKFIPKIFWVIDEQERYVIEIDKVFDEINNQNDSVD